MKRKFKILLTLFVAFATTSIASNTVFIAGTPYINKPFLAELRSSPGVFFQRTGDYLASLRYGKKGVENYQKQRVEEYVTQTWKMSPTGSPPLSKPTRPEEYAAQGYTEAAKDVYGKKEESTKTIYVYIGADAKFEKKMIDVGGRQMEAWVPL